MNKNKPSSNIEELISSNKTEKAIDLLIKCFKGKDDYHDDYDISLNLKSRYLQQKKMEQLGVSDGINGNPEINRIKIGHPQKRYYFAQSFGE